MSLMRDAMLQAIASESDVVTVMGAKGRRDCWLLVSESERPSAALVKQRCNQEGKRVAELLAQYLPAPTFKAMMARLADFDK